MMPHPLLDERGFLLLEERARLPLAVHFRLLEERFRFPGRRLHSSGINAKRVLQSIKILK